MVVCEKYRFGSESVYNIDEMWLTTVHNPSKIIAANGDKQVLKVTFAEKRTLVTVFCADTSEEQGECFHQDIKEMKKRYKL